MSTETNPRVGMMARVRNRRGVIVSVDPFDTKSDGRLHMVRVEYADGEGTPDDLLLWERETRASLLEPAALPRVAEEPPMAVPDFEALTRATRWTAMTPFVATDGTKKAADLPIASPFFGAVQVEDFQLLPLLRALGEPRVSLLLADDVGLGKTIEAGLVLQELLLRRRIRRVLVLTPASLRRQWQQEMKDKFSLSFDVVDREATHDLHTRLGLDANPWRTFPRIIASYHYLRQPDVLQQLESASQLAPGSSNLPWDLLIVDEAHNLMPSSYGEDSDLAKMLRKISPWFEHRLFLTATPHNGHTQSFTGLLESLDPVRFTQKPELEKHELARVEEVVVRRLKREINELDDERGRPRRFAERHLEALPLYFSPTEKGLWTAFDSLRTAIRSAVAKAAPGERTAGYFAIEVLGKRLLSCPSTFAESWRRVRQGSNEEAATAAEVSAAKTSVDEEIDDDREREGRVEHAALTVGAWLRPFAEAVTGPMKAVDAALTKLGLAEGDAPKDDARFDRLVVLIDKHLRHARKWRDDERLIVFTEYKTSLDSLVKRLRAHYGDKGTVVRELFGGLDLSERERIKDAFNDAADPVRILIATDAAAEGLNLQETSRLLLHFDIPWNPSRLEQRNGRLDRHGQARDVTVHHFVCEEQADLKFLAHVVAKVHTIREDLGSLGDVFDAAFERRFKYGDDERLVAADLDREADSRKGKVQLPRSAEVTAEEAQRLVRLATDLDLSAPTLRTTLEMALGFGVGQPRIEGPDELGRLRLKAPIPPRWQGVIDDGLRLPARDGGLGAIPAIAFDAAAFVEEHDGRRVFRPRRDTALLHLGHPLFREALSLFARQRFPGGHEAPPSRWIARRGPVPRGVDALVLVTVEELATNDLREPFHQWVRTLRFPVVNKHLGAPLAYVAPGDEGPFEAISTKLLDQARDVWELVGVDVRDRVKVYAKDLTALTKTILASEGKAAASTQAKTYDKRIHEVRAYVSAQSVEKLQRERAKLEKQLQQTTLAFDEHRQRDLESRLATADEELVRRRRNADDHIHHLQAERARVVDRLVPKRYTLHGTVQVYPVTVEIRFPAGAS
jgi:superfamily II DNA or RNA helicase